MAFADRITLELLDALGPREAAARLFVGRLAGLLAEEQAAVEQWIAADDAHKRALADVELAWATFDAPCDNEILAAMRACAIGSTRD